MRPRITRTRLGKPETDVGGHGLDSVTMPGRPCQKPCIMSDSSEKTAGENLPGARSAPGPAPGRKIEVMQISLASFVCGLVGLVPLLGLPFALAAFVLGRRARRSSSAWANPADRYARVAAWIGPLGLLISGAFVLLLFGIGSDAAFAGIGGG